MTDRPLWVRHEGAAKRKAGAYIGYAGYANIMACTKTPALATDVAQQTGIDPHNTRRLLRQFHALRLVHIVGWQRPAHGFVLPIYALGDGISVPAPLTVRGTKMPFTDFRPRLQQRVVAFASVIHALGHPITKGELEVETGISVSRISELLRHMLLPHVRLVYRCGWQRREDGFGPWMAQFAYGPDRADVRRPAVNKAQARERKNCRGRMLRAIRKPAWALLVSALKQAAPIRRDSRQAETA